MKRHGLTNLQKAGLGVCGAILVAVVATRSQAPPGAAAWAAASPRYKEQCAVAYVAAKRLAPVLRYAEPAISDPGILKDGPPVRLECALMEDGRATGAVTADVLCGAIEADCLSLVSAQLDGRILYVNMKAVDAELAEVRRKHPEAFKSAAVVKHHAAAGVAGAPATPAPAASDPTPVTAVSEIVAPSGLEPTSASQP